MSDLDTVLTVAPTTVASIGTHTVTVVKESPDLPDLSTDLDFVVT
jgi:hypothetical protein